MHVTWPLRLAKVCPARREGVSGARQRKSVQLLKLKLLTETQFYFGVLKMRQSRLRVCLLWALALCGLALAQYGEQPQQDQQPSPTDAPAGTDQQLPQQPLPDPPPNDAANIMAMTMPQGTIRQEIDRRAIPAEIHYPVGARDMSMDKLDEMVDSMVPSLRALRAPDNPAAAAAAAVAAAERPAISGEANPLPRYVPASFPTSSPLNTLHGRPRPDALAEKPLGDDRMEVIPLDRFDDGTMGGRLGGFIKAGRDPACGTEKYQLVDALHTWHDSRVVAANRTVHASKKCHDDMLDAGCDVASKLASSARMYAVDMEQRMKELRSAYLDCAGEDALPPLPPLERWSSLLPSDVLGAVFGNLKAEEDALPGHDRQVQWALLSNFSTQPAGGAGNATDALAAAAAAASRRRGRKGVPDFQAARFRAIRMARVRSILTGEEV